MLVPNPVVVGGKKAAETSKKVSKKRVNCLSRLQVLGGGPQQLSCLHTSTSLDSKDWERRNRKVFPPQLPEEIRRPAEIHHSRRQIKYSKDKMWYLAKMVLEEAQEMAVKNHNVEYRSNLYVAESYSGKGKYLKRIRYHGRGMFGIMDKVYCHYFVKLVEGSPPKTEEKTSFDQAKDYVQNLKNRTIIHTSERTALSLPRWLLTGLLQDLGGQLRDVLPRLSDVSGVGRACADGEAQDEAAGEQARHQVNPMLPMAPHSMSANMAGLQWGFGGDQGSKVPRFDIGVDRPLFDVRQ
ncbi:hypothetical protein FQN60_000344, partial [Etheostoma spectabile]